MIASFDMQQLNSILADFYKVTSIRITVFDDEFHELAAYPPERAKLCRLIRRCPAGAEACARCDRDACETVAKRHTSYLYRCHAGLTESIEPLFMGNIVIGYLFFGQVFCQDDAENALETIRENCTQYGLEPDEAEAACREQPMLSMEYVQSASHLLQAVAKYLCMSRIITLRQQSLPMQIDEYISAHFSKDITTESLCDRFRIGRSRLYEIAAQNYGCGLASHIRGLRMQKARTLLETEPDMPISDIAAACGYSDYNYFITVFRRETGTTPRRYAKEKHIS